MKTILTALSILISVSAFAQDPIQQQQQMIAVGLENYLRNEFTVTATDKTARIAQVNDLENRLNIVTPTVVTYLNNNGKNSEEVAQIINYAHDLKNSAKNQIKKVPQLETSASIDYGIGFASFVLGDYANSVNSFLLSYQYLSQVRTILSDIYMQCVFADGMITYGINRIE